MTPFNFAKAIAGHPLITRDGRKVEEFHFFEKVNVDLDICIYVVIGGEIRAYRKNGKWLEFEDSALDLFLSTIKVKQWINIYKTLKNYVCVFGTYDTKEDALINKDNDCIGTIEIEFEDPTTGEE
jgi:hypothetical protein